MRGSFLPIHNYTTVRNGEAMAARPDNDMRKAAPRSASPQGELEQYGVWVKAEPQDIVEEPEATAEIEESFDLGLPEESAPLPEEAFLTEDEEELLGSFEELEAEEPAPKAAKAPAESRAAPGPAFPDIEDLPELEDFGIPEEPEPPRAAAPSAARTAKPAAFEAEPVEDFGSATIDISLDDLETVSREPSPIRPDAEIDISSIEGLEELPEFAPAAKEERASPESASFDIEDVSAEFLDLGGEEKPSAPSGGAHDVSSEFLEAEPQAVEPLEGESADFEPIDIDLHFDDTIPSGGRAGSEEEAGFESVSEFDDFLSEGEAKPAPAAKPAKAAPKAEPGFDDLAALERELAEPAPEAPPSRPAAAAPQSALSNELLVKIADELASIRGELVNLKGQLGSIQREGLAPAPCEPAPAAEAEPKQAGAAAGFFDEEEDETIALTGDELDNILNTADFTEETPAEEAALGEEEISLHEEGLSEEILLPESGDYAAPEPAIEEIRLEPAIEEEPEAPKGEDLDLVEELLSDGGVTPMTSAPEDTSYLEESLAAEVDLGFAETPLAEAPLVEPDLSELDLETEELEPSVEVTEELPVIEGLQAAAEEEPLEDLTLGIEGSAEYLSEQVPEAESLEPLPEIEETSFGEISLAEEGLAELEPELEELAAEEPTLDEEISERTVKPAQPVALNPDQIPLSLDESYFVGSEPAAAEAPLEEAALEEEPLEEISFGETSLEEAPAAAMEPAGAMEPAEEPLPSLESFGVPEAEETLELAAEAEEPLAKAPSPAPRAEGGTDRLKGEIRSVLSYLDKLLESLPEDKIEEFARSEYFDTYKKLFEELGLV